MARTNVGGPALQATVLTRGLDPERFEQRLVAGTVATDEEDYVRLRAPDLPVVRIPGLGRAPNMRGDLQAVRGLLAEIRRFRPHIVHTHTAKAGALGRAGAWTCRVPATVHTFHGHLLHGYFSPRKTKALIQVERNLARFTGNLVAVGSQVRDELLAAGIGRPEQYTVVPPGVEPAPRPTRADARRCLALPADGLVVAFVARLTRIKRPERFIEMASRLSPRYPDATFVIAGEGDSLDTLLLQAAPLGSRVRFLGWRSDVEHVYAAADVVVLTSDNEGMPVSLIEGAFAGRPAVTTDVGSAREVVIDGQTGFVTGCSIDELVRATDLLLSDAARREQMGSAARLRAQQCFSADRLVADIAALYESIATAKAFDARPR